MPGKAVRAAAAVTLAALLAAVMLVAAAQPTAATTTWMPQSRAIEPLGPLVLGPTEIRWSICRGARVAYVAADKSGSVYTLGGQPGCVLDGQHITHLKLVARAGAAGRCDAELSLFTSEKARRDAEPEAWGLVARSPCP